MTVEELIVIKTDSPAAVPPRPPQLNSIPSLLSSLQNQWDAFALETFSLRQQLAKARQELSTALYYHDASLRVIARLTEERDEARASLAQLSASIGTSSVQPESTEADGTADNSQQESTEEQSGRLVLPSSHVEKITATRDALIAERKKRKHEFGDYATAEEISALTALSKPSKQFFTNVHSFSLNPSTLQFILSGGAASKAGIFNALSAASHNTLFTSKSGIITSSLWINDSTIALGTKTGNIELYSVEIPTGDGPDLKAELVSSDPVAIIDVASKTENQDSAAIKTLRIHPTGDLLLSLTSNSLVSIHDISDKENPTTLSEFTYSLPLSTVDIHPDGMLVAFGRAMSPVIDIQILNPEIPNSSLELPEEYYNGHNADQIHVASMSFAENGYWLAASYAVNNNNDESEDSMDVDNKSFDIAGSVFVWDLRKQKVSHVVKFPSIISEISSALSSGAAKSPLKKLPVLGIDRIQFDKSSTYMVAKFHTHLAVVSYVKAEKKWSSSIGEEEKDLFSFTASHEIADIAWGPLARYLYIITQKGAIQTFGLDK